MKSGDDLYDVSQVRIADDPPTRKTEPNPNDAWETQETPNESAPGAAKIRVIPLLAFVVVGLLLGQYFISPQMLPRSVHVVQQFRGAAIGALLGVLMYAMMDYFFPRDS